MPAPSNKDAFTATELGFRQMAEAIGAVFRMTDAEGHTLYLSPGFEEIWGRPCDVVYSSTRAWFDAVHPEDRDRILEAALGIHKTGGYDEEYRIVRPNGSIRWVRERAFVIRNEKEKPWRFAALAEDVTERKLMEKEVLELNDRERAQLGRDLHDGICQQLVSIAFATDLLRRDLAAKSPGEAVRAAKISGLLDTAITQARNLSNALCPVNLAGDGLAVALRSLAESVNRGAGVVCGSECSEKVFIHDFAVAAHLYRIAQEAVQNAIKHANATKVLIRLAQEKGTIRLTVSDNGSSRDKRAFEAGLSIIRFRANMAGGRLQMEKNPKGGAHMMCAFQQDTSEDRRVPETDFQLLSAK